MDETGDGSICYESESNGCEIEGQEYGDVTLTGTYDICGFPVSYNEEEGRLEDLDGRTLYISGSVTADSANTEARTCDYDLEITKIAISGEGDSLTFSSGVSGQICGRRNFSASIEFEVANDISGMEEGVEATPTPSPAE